MICDMMSKKRYRKIVSIKCIFRAYFVLPPVVIPTTVITTISNSTTGGNISSLSIEWTLISGDRKYYSSFLMIDIVVTYDK